MIKLVIFDIDNTLAKLNKPIDYEATVFLNKIESLGVRVALISGKPAAYISGLARQLGLINPIVVGENGAYTYYSSSFPPQKEIAIAIGKQISWELKELEISILKEFGEKIWIQPNIVNLSIFPLTEKAKVELFQYVTTYASTKSLYRNFKIYTYSDSIEVVPLNVDKGIALRKIKTIEKLKTDELIAVGDAENDIPMFKEAGISIGINLSVADYNFLNIKEAIKFIQELIETKSN